MHAICSEIGCIQQPAASTLSLGVRLTLPNKDTAVLLPGSYKADTPSSNAAESFLSRFLSADATQDVTQGFAVDLQPDNISTVALSASTSLLAYSSPYFSGSNDSAVDSIQSFILRSDYFAVFNVTGPLKTIQAHTGVHDVRAWNLGPDIKVTLSSVALKSDIKDPYCQNGSFRDGDKCSECAEPCGNCYGSTALQCLSCPPNYRLQFGTCAPIVCLNGASKIAGIGLCLEELSTFSDPNVSAPSAFGTSKATIIVPAAIGFALSCLTLFFLYKSRRKTSMNRQNLQLWADRAFQAQNQIQNSNIDPSGLPFNSGYGHVRKGSESEISSGHQRYAAPSILSDEEYVPYSVAPESDGGPAARDDFDARQRDLQRRKDLELARLRQEVRSSTEKRKFVDKRRKRGMTLTSITSVNQELWEMKQLKQLAKDFDDSSSLSSTSSHHTRKMAPPTPRSGHTRNRSRTNVFSTDRNPGSSHLDSWRRDLKKTQPDPVPLAQTIFTSAAPINSASTPLHSAPLTGTSSKFAKIQEWAQQPKSAVATARTIVGGATTLVAPMDDASEGAPTIIKTHSRKGSKATNNSPKSEFSFLTSVSRNALRQAQIKAKQEAEEH